MDNLNGDAVVECGEDCRRRNSLLMVEGSEMEAVEKADSESADNRKGCKRCRSNPVGEELEIELEGMKEKKKTRKDHVNGDSRSFFDCSICLDMAREPVVTYCGHLFCWPCFYKLRYLDSTAKTKECPVCRGEVTDSAIVPIYGNAESIEESESESGAGVIIPPRPKGLLAGTERTNQPLRLSQLPTPDVVDGQASLEEAYNLLFYRDPTDSMW